MVSADQMADEFEEEFTDDDLRELQRIVQQAALRSYPNPERTGCPGSRVLEEVANAKAPFQHPAYAHVKTCSPCLAEMLELRNAKASAKKGAQERGTPNGITGARISRSRRVRRPSQVLIVAVSALALIVVISLALWKILPRVAGLSPENQQNAQIERTINLWDKDALRGVGEATPIETDNLPAALLRLKIILPRLSEGGRYTVAVTRDKYGSDVVTKGDATAQVKGQRQIVTVNLDLRGKKPGNYFLQTTREGDASSYFYPLKIE